MKYKMSSDEPVEQDIAPIKKTPPNRLVIGVIILVGVAAFFAGSYMANPSSDQISREDLDEAIAKLELRILQDRQPAQMPVKISADDDPIIGDPDAPITIIEFSDFQCPFCARFHTQTLPSILKEYVEQGKVRLVFRDFPIQSIHPNALPAAVAAECANDQGRFKGMHDILFDRQNEWSSLDTTGALAMFVQYASEVQLEQESFSLCLTDGEQVAEIQRDIDDGRRYDVTGTPGFFIGNDEIGYVVLKGAQPFENFERIIDSQLEA